MKISVDELRQVFESTLELKNERDELKDKLDEANDENQRQEGQIVRLYDQIDLCNNDITELRLENKRLKDDYMNNHKYEITIERFAELMVRMIYSSFCNDLVSRMRCNEKINAMKVFKDTTGCSLREAKNSIELMYWKR